MKSSELKQHVAIRNIALATDFDASSNRALPFATRFAERYGAKLYVVHVVPREVYAFARPESVEQILIETHDSAASSIDRILSRLRDRGQSCEGLVGEGDVFEEFTQLLLTHSIDLVVMGTKSRGGIGKVLLGSIAEEVIRHAPCPVLTVGPHVTADASTGFRNIVCAVDFSASSPRAVQLAISVAYEYGAHLVLLHVLEGALRKAPNLAIFLTENRLRKMVSVEFNLQSAPQVVVEIGPVAGRILGVASDLRADVIVTGVRGVGGFGQAASRFGSIAHDVVSLAKCPVLTVGDGTENSMNDDRH